MTRDEPLTREEIEGLTQSQFPSIAQLARLALAAKDAEGLKVRLAALTDDERLALFNDYCKHCGSEDPSCQCWNDE